MTPNLPSTNEGDQFECIAFGELGVSVLAAGNDLTVAFDGDGAVGEAEFGDQFCECGSFGGFFLAVEGDLHGGIVGRIRPFADSRLGLVVEAAGGIGSRGG
jgi:hypothetical protein